MLRKLINRIKVVDLPWSSKRFRGYDLDGNMYFEEPSRREGISQSRRFVRYADGRYNPHEYDPNMIPIQWQSWMRHTRDATPTLEELVQDVQRKENTKTLVEALESKEKVEKKQEFQPTSWNPKKLQ